MVIFPLIFTCQSSHKWSKYASVYAPTRIYVMFYGGNPHTWKNGLYIEPVSWALIYGN